MLRGSVLCNTAILQQPFQAQGFFSGFCTSDQTRNSKTVDKDIVKVLTAREEFSYHIKIRSD